MGTQQSCPRADDISYNNIPISFSEGLPMAIVCVKVYGFAMVNTNGDENLQA